MKFIVVYIITIILLTNNSFNNGIKSNVDCLDYLEKIISKKQIINDSTCFSIKYSLETQYNDPTMQPNILQYEVIKSYKSLYNQNGYVESYQDDSLNIIILHNKKLINIIPSIPDSIFKLNYNYQLYFHDSLIKHCELISCREENINNVNYFEVKLKINSYLRKPLGNSTLTYYYDLTKNMLKEYSFYYYDDALIKSVTFHMNEYQENINSKTYKFHDLKEEITNGKYLNYKIIDLRKKFNNK